MSDEKKTGVKLNLEFYSRLYPNRYDLTNLCASPSGMDIFMRDLTPDPF